MPAATIDRPPAAVQDCASAQPDAAPVLPRDVEAGNHVRSLAAAVIGFVSGAAVWHFVGFWGFVSTVLLHGPQQVQPSKTGAPPLLAAFVAPGTSSPLPAEPAKSRLPVASPSQPGEDPAIIVDDNCSTLELKRLTGEIITTSCRGNLPSVQQALGRGDRAMAAANADWIVQVDAQTDLTR
jgi:hypothetical protein